MSIIQTLNDAIHDGAVSAEAAKAACEIEPYYKKIVDTLGLDFLDGLNDAEAGYHGAQYRACYDRGFTDCFQLWLEVFSKYSS